MDDLKLGKPTRFRAPRYQRALLIAGAGLVVVAVVAGIGYLVVGGTSAGRTDPKHAVPSTSVAPRGQVELPFGVRNADGLEMDSAGNVYVSDASTDRVLELKVGSDAPVPLPLPFTGLGSPGGLAIDGDNSVYVVDQPNKRVLKLPAAGGNPRPACRRPGCSLEALGAHPFSGLGPWPLDRFELTPTSTAAVGSTCGAVPGRTEELRLRYAAGQGRLRCTFQPKNCNVF